MTLSSETGLYDPVKALLEGQGYEVKGEIGAADVMAVRGDEAPVIVELKLRFSLALFHQAISRLSITDFVYVAVPRPTGKTARRSLRDNKAMCRRLGVGLICVSGKGRAEVICDPGPYKPRKSAARTRALLGEFQRRRGDPSKGGATRTKIMTAYRQDAIACGAHLAASGPSRGVDVAKATGVETATRIMRDNHYGWFFKVERGWYDLTNSGKAAISGTNS
jgi:hypothetical protein